MKTNIAEMILLVSGLVAMSPVTSWADNYNGTQCYYSTSPNGTQHGPKCGTSNVQNRRNACSNAFDACFSNANLSQYAQPDPDGDGPLAAGPLHMNEVRLTAACNGTYTLPDGNSVNSHCTQTGNPAAQHNFEKCMARGRVAVYLNQPATQGQPCNF